ncbi:MAG: type II secretion system protein [Ghiorsea sp.]
MKENGFSLVELLVVIGIIGILASIAVPQFSSMQNGALNAGAVSSLKLVELHEKQFKSDHYAFAPFGVADNINGTISITVGSNTFEAGLITEDVEVLTKTSANGQNAIIAAKQSSSQTIVAMDLDNQGAIYKLENQNALTDAAIPASTSANDLSGWTKF